MDHSNHVRISQQELTPALVEGATIYDLEDQEVGKIDHLHGQDLAIVDVGGFLGIGAKPVAVPVTDLDFMRDENGDVHALTKWSKDHLESLPEHRH